MINLTRSLALELAPFGIRVNCLCPGITDTRMSQAAIYRATDPARARDVLRLWAPIGRWADAAEQAEAAFFLLHSATFSVGSVLVTDGGYTAR